jgi:uncharacterized protein (DUF1810 family)
MSDTPGLQRFLDAQADTFELALSELQAGQKRSHWMWFIFPQLVGLGRSSTALLYGIRSLDEAKAYLAHPVLGPRLEESVAALLSWRTRRSATEILGAVDSTKLKSSMTLFEAAGGGPLFGGLLDAFYDGARDPATLALLRASE